MAKRAFDLVLSALALLLLAPLLAVIALWIRFDSPGPVFFRQERVGLHGRPFRIHKFRTMVHGAAGLPLTVGADARITRAGAWLRRSKFDELPQLIDVLAGDMSIVGPRPERPEFVEQLKEIIPYYSERHLVKPGVTGWAQVNYPYGASVEDAIEKLRYDLYYLKNFSIQLDVMIILETVKVVFNQRGGR